MNRLFKLLGMINIKSIYLNFYLLPFHQAYKLPILFSKNLKILSIHRGNIGIDSDIVKTGMVQIGYDNAGIIDSRYQRSVLQFSRNSKLIFRGNAKLCSGTRIVVGNKAKMIVENGVAITGNTSLICYCGIEIGSDTIISWDCLIMDTDFHKIIENGSVVNNDKPIYIGTHVWIGCKNTILKGSYIPKDVIIAANPTIAKKLIKSNCIYGGTPVRLLKENVEWEG